MESEVKISRPAAEQAGLKNYFTGHPCKYGHVAFRLVSTRVCAECSRLRAKAVYQTEAGKARLLVWQKENKTRVAKVRLIWQQKNKVRLYAAEAERRQNNKEKIKLQWAAAKKRRRAAATADQNLRRARKLQATPKWANCKEIENIYKKCKQISDSTKIKHHVDHIVPLSGDLVCGLHVESNLQIIPAAINMKKSNKHNV